ncbi:sulfurtransferase [Paenibacillus koleovorans]|uniref:sulfurtransferase n=1 Tax=Paenibacillus koleovorans TaxID=121608 RepID=UPI000FDA818A|nr:rhodanese-like domain-containing protein [Paenibacillus koleovorans]
MNEVSKKWLLARMYEPDLVIADCRCEPDEPGAGRRAYEMSHIPGAVYLDLSAYDDTMLRRDQPDAAQVAELERLFSRAGIGEESRVVAYDDQQGAWASWLQALLRALGHETAYRMDEDYSVWAGAGYPVTAAQNVVVPAAFIARLQS